MRALSGRPGRSGSPTAAYRLLLDGARCDGHGICSIRCPERVALDEWGFAVVDATPVSSPTSLDRARRACRACPAGALDLVAADWAPSPPEVTRSRRRRARR
ncbi:MAG: ferredoxin [Actinomycetota bacterium]|nr:ferredoxin [Actinomycetota bacterium]